MRQMLMPRRHPTALMIGKIASCAVMKAVSASSGPMGAVRNVVSLMKADMGPEPALEVLPVITSISVYTAFLP